MDAFRDFINALSVDAQRAFAARCGTTIGYMRKCLATHARFNEKTCVAIEQATAGAVTRRDLRPDDWAQIWPELAETVEASDRASH